MATIILKLDKRRANARGQYPVQLQLSHDSRTTTIGTGVSVREEFWNGEVNRAVFPHCPNAKSVNEHIEVLYFKYTNALRELERAGAMDGIPVAEIRKMLTEQPKSKLVTTFNSHFNDFINRKDRESTANIYRHTLSKISAYAQKVNHCGDWTFEQITLEWLNGFEWFLKTQHLNDKNLDMDGVCKLGVNGIAIHLRNIRAVINSAIDEELTAVYPFRKFKIKHEETVKRSLSVEELRALRDYACEPYQAKYRDLFMLIFYLVGINTVDLFSLTEVHNGRIEYRRSKTGRLFSIKVEPEAQAIIDKYRGQSQLLDVLDTYVNYKDFAHRMNSGLQSIGPVERVANKAVDPKYMKRNKKKIAPLFPGQTTYWARHTWATIAAELDIPDETISLALGHSSGNRVTNIYINRNQKKVDEANRKVIDYLLG